MTVVVGYIPDQYGEAALTAGIEEAQRRGTGLVVVNATKDSIQFSVGEAKKSLALTGPVYKLLGKPDHLRHAIFEGPHDYSKVMREAMYGWMARWLKGDSDGKPIPEPKFTTEPPEALRCFPDLAKRPQPWVTAGMLAKREAKRLVDENYAKPPREAEEWE